MDSQTSLLYNKSLRFLSFRPRSVFEMKTYLVKNKASESQIAEIIQKLSDLNFLNDLEFAEKWVADRKKSHPRSLFVLKLELLQKGLSQEIIDKVLTVQKEQNQDLSMAVNIVLKIISRFSLSPQSSQSTPELKAKLISHLRSKGFSWEIIKTAIDEVFKKE